MTGRAGAAAVLLAVIGIGAGLHVAVAPATAVIFRPDLASTDPIYISGNAELYAGNGVTGGSGTSADPYVISGWSIRGSCNTCVGRWARPMIDIHNTTAHILIQNVLVSSGDVYNDCISLTNVSNVTVRAVDSDVCGSMVAVIDSHDVDVTGLKEGHSNEVTVLVDRSARVTVHDTQLSEFTVNGSSRVEFRADNISGGGQFYGIYRSDQVRLIGNRIGAVRVGFSTNLSVEANVFLNRSSLLIDYGYGWYPIENGSWNWSRGPYSHNISVRGNTFEAGEVSLAGSQDVVVSGNRWVVDNTSVGPLWASGFRNLTVTDNEIVGGIRAFRAQYGSGLRFEFNEVSDSHSNGLEIYGVSDAVLRNNTIARANGTGLWIENVSGFHVYNNNFEGNRYQAVDVDGTGEWDGGYGAGGNFWSDYNGSDLCSGELQENCTGGDGYGDTPRGFQSESQDRYPLMKRAASDPPAPPVPPPGSLGAQPFILDPATAGRVAVALILLVAGVALFVIAARRRKLPAVEDEGPP